MILKPLLTRVVARVVVTADRGSGHCKDTASLSTPEVVENRLCLMMET